MDAIGNNSVCYQAVQRIFRNAVVKFLREHLSSAFPANHPDQLKRPLKKEWNELQAAANLSRSSGGTETTIRDEYDILSVAHFYGIFDAYYSQIFQCPLAQADNLETPNRPKFLGTLKAIKDFRDPLSHPVEEEISYEEAVGVLTDARQVLRALNLKDAADDVVGLIRSLDTFEDRSYGSPVCVLPTQDSIYMDFVGRRTVLNNLKVLFEEQFARRCLLAGDGGKGKSAVAYRYAQTVVAKSNKFQMVVWLSAKKKRFEAGKTVVIDSPDFFDLESAVNALLVQYGPVDENLTLNQKHALLMECLNDYPTFVIADDIDSVLSDAEVVELFTFSIPNTASRVLLTSRRDIPGIKSLIIAGFSVPEAETFIHSRIQQYELSSKSYSSSIIRQIREVCDGSPLYIDDLMRLSKIVEPQRAISMWKEKQGDAARRYALERELEKLSQDAKGVLIASVVSDHPVSFTEISEVLGFSEDRLLSAMTELHTLFLLPQPSLVEGEQRYHLNTNTKRLILDVEGQTDIYSRIEKKSKALSGQLPAVGRDIVGQLIRQALLLVNGGRFDDGETLLLRSIEHTPHAADLYGFLGYLYKTKARITDARIKFEDAARLKSKNEDTYIHWIAMEVSEKEYTSAVRAAELAVSIIPPSYRLVELRAEAKYRLAADYVSRLQTEKAEKLWREIIEETEAALKPRSSLSPVEEEINSGLLRRLVICHDHLGEINELNARFAQWKRDHNTDPAVSRHREILSRRRGNLFRG